MPRSRLLPTAYGLVLLTALMSGDARAQVTSGAVPDSLIADLAYVRQRLTPLLAQLVEERPDLVERHSDIQRRILGAIRGVDPSLQERMDRYQDLGTELQEARRVGDRSAYTRVMNEGLAIEDAVAAVRDQVMATGTLAVDIADFRTEVMDGLTALGWTSRSHSPARRGEWKAGACGGFGRLD